MSTLIQQGGQESLLAALGQLEKSFGPAMQGRIGSGPLAANPLAFQSGAAAVAMGAGMGAPLSVAQGLQPQLPQMMQSLGAASGSLQQNLLAAGAPLGSSMNAQLATQFEATMDEAIRLHLSGNPADGVQAQALMQQALGMAPGPKGAATSPAGPVSTGIPQRVAAGMPSPTLAPTSGGGGGGTAGSGAAAMGGGLDAMMAQAEALLRSDSMESQLAGQRLMAKALRMFELISKMIEKQSEMASKAIAAIK
ncbi:MAG: hypothetical protein MUF01_08120 [Bryobacterales bacterium]|nr:hypothetical protein [Bryobacterales bacterium]